MLICDDFNILNFPKTGSTFVRDVIKEIYEARYKKNSLLKIAQRLKIIEPPFTELLLPNFQSPNRNTRHGKGQHGAYCQIPERYIDKKIVAVIRNPYEIFLSTYKMGWWQKFYPLKKEELFKRFPEFPNLSINEYIELLKSSTENKTELHLGSHTVQFIRIFFKNPENVLMNISENYITSEDLYKNDMPENITFLRQENLNEELANYLSSYNFTPYEIEFVRSHKKVNESENKSIDNNTIWTREALLYVAEYERFLFKIFKDLGADYPNPKISF